MWHSSKKKIFAKRERISLLRAKTEPEKPIQCVILCEKGGFQTSEMNQPLSACVVGAG